MAVALAAVAVFGFAGRMLAQIKRPAGSTPRLAAGAHSLRVSVSRDELGRLLESFSQLASTLESKDRMRRRFLADISHDLRTPLSILQSELEALEDGIRPLTSASVRSLRAEVLTLSALVSDLYDLALADTGALAYRFQDVNVTDLVRSAVDAFRERFSARRLSVEMDWNRDEPLRVKGDPDRLRQLLNNLLENSVRHTHSGGSLRVALTRADGSVQLDFQDSAPNVPPKLLPRLFERSFRVDASRGGGAGLGLALCRSIVEAHHGKIDALPCPLGGLWIRIRLPRAKP